MNKVITSFITMPMDTTDAIISSMSLSEIDFNLRFYSKMAKQDDKMKTYYITMEKTYRYALELAEYCYLNNYFITKPQKQYNTEKLISEIIYLKKTITSLKNDLQEHFRVHNLNKKGNWYPI